MLFILVFFRPGFLILVYLFKNCFIKSCIQTIFITCNFKHEQIIYMHYPAWNIKCHLHKNTCERPPLSSSPANPSQEDHYSEFWDYHLLTSLYWFSIYKYILKPYVLYLTVWLNKHNVCKERNFCFLSPVSPSVSSVIGLPPALRENPSRSHDSCTHIWIMTVSVTSGWKTELFNSAVTMLNFM